MLYYRRERGSIRQSVRAGRARTHLGTRCDAKWSGRQVLFYWGVCCISHVVDSLAQDSEERIVCVGALGHALKMRGRFSEQFYWRGSGHESHASTLSLNVECLAPALWYQTSLHGRDLHRVQPETPDGSTLARQVCMRSCLSQLPYLSLPPLETQLQDFLVKDRERKGACLERGTQRVGSTHSRAAAAVATTRCVGASNPTPVGPIISRPIDPCCSFVVRLAVRAPGPRAMLSASSGSGCFRGRCRFSPFGRWEDVRQVRESTLECEDLQEMVESRRRSERGIGSTSCPYEPASTHVSPGLVLRLFVGCVRWLYLK